MKIPPHCSPLLTSCQSSPLAKTNQRPESKGGHCRGPPRSAPRAKSGTEVEVDLQGQTEDVLNDDLVELPFQPSWSVPVLACSVM